MPFDPASRRRRCRRAAASLSLVIVALLTPSAAPAQSLNLDFGTSTPLPDPNYAAVGEAGPWLKIAGTVSSYILEGDPNAEPNAPGVLSLTFNLPFGPSTFDHPDTTGNLEALLDDYFDLRSTPVIMRFHGLQPGRYRVLTYAWGPDNENFVTFVGVDDIQQDIGGPWPGGLETPAVYADHTTDILPGEVLDIRMFGLPKGTLNATQLVLLTPFTCQADQTGDGRIDLDDLLFVLGNFGCKTGDADCLGDTDGDHDTDLDDLLLILAFFGQNCA
jgi:hypothetical protein